MIQSQPTPSEPLSIETVRMLAVEEIYDFLRECHSRQAELEKENEGLRQELACLKQAPEHTSPEVLLGQAIITCVRDLRNPLMGVRMAVDYILPYLSLTDTRQRAVTLLHQDLQAIERSFEDLLFVAYLQPLILHPARLRFILEREVARLKPGLEKKRAHLRLDIARSLPLLYVDAERLSRALEIFLDHRAEAAQPDDILHLSLKAKDGGQVITLTDSGRDISSQHPERVFEPSCRAGPGRKGLGLFVVQQVVQHHQGQIVVQRNGDKGARFTITLPALTPARR